LFTAVSDNDLNKNKTNLIDFWRSQMRNYFSSLVAAAVAVSVLAIVAISPAAAHSDVAAFDTDNQVAFIEPIALTDDNAVMADAPADVLIEATADVLASDAAPDVYGDALSETAAEAAAETEAKAGADATANATAKAGKVLAARSGKQIAIAM
jgi:hypothetical protein